MKVLRTQAHLTDQELKAVLDSQSTTRGYKDWQIIYSVQTNTGKKAEEIASILGVNKHKIYHVIESYNKKGIKWRTHDNWGGRRASNCHLSLDEEKSLLKRLEKKALSGEILIYKHIKKEVEKRIGHEVSDDYVWDLFKRHDWKKKVPRASHPKSDKDVQEAFKKNSKRVWIPNN